MPTADGFRYYYYYFAAVILRYAQSAMPEIRYAIMPCYDAMPLPLLAYQHSRRYC